MSFSDEELVALLEDTESDRVERKESWKGDAPEKGRQAVCAFANDLPDHRKPGVLFVGARDDGSPAEIEVTDELLRTLADMRTDGNILPPPSLVVEKRHLKGHDVAVVMVRPSHAPPVRCRGRIWIRIGPRRALATAQDERVLGEKRRWRDIPFDVQPLPSAPVSSLSRLIFEQEYLPNAFAPDVLDANERSYEERLSACRMISSPPEASSTVLGQLVLGVSPRDWLPGAYVQFLRFQGRDLDSPIIDEALIDGALGQVMRLLDQRLDLHDARRVDIASEAREVRSMPFPRVALQQLSRNAILHRSYENTNAPVRIYWFDDRIEFISPGGPFGSVTRENFGAPGLTDYRNPNLADAMRVLGYVQRFGVGIQMARAALRTNGNPDLEYKIEAEYVVAIVRRSP